MDSEINSFGFRITKAINEEISSLKDRLTHGSYTSACRQIHKQERTKNDRLIQTIVALEGRLKRQHDLLLRIMEVFKKEKQKAVFLNDEFGLEAMSGRIHVNIASLNRCMGPLKFYKLKAECMETMKELEETCWDDSLLKLLKERAPPSGAEKKGPINSAFQFGAWSFGIVSR